MLKQKSVLVLSDLRRVMLAGGEGGGAPMRERPVVSHKRGLSLNPAGDVICGLSLLIDLVKRGNLLKLSKTYQSTLILRLSLPSKVKYVSDTL